MSLTFKKKKISTLGSITRGLTIVETMLILMLLIIIISALIPFIFYQKKESTKESAADTKEQQDVLLIKNALNFYLLDNGFYPTTAQGLNALVKKPEKAPIPQNWVQYMTTLPVDQWGQPYQYKNTGHGKSINIFSCGQPQKKQGKPAQACTK